MEEEDLGDELGVNVEWFLKVDVVGHLETDSECHLGIVSYAHINVMGSAYVNDTEDDRHFHLERVGKDQSVIGTVPVWIDTEGVYGTGADGRHGSLSVLWPVPAVLPNV